LVLTEISLISWVSMGSGVAGSRNRRGNRVYEAIERCGSLDVRLSIAAFPVPGEGTAEVWMANKKTAAKKKPVEMLLVQSKVKEYVREHEMMCSSDLIEALNEEVGRLLDRSVQRAQDNGRKTARASDV
jgi:histone H3/H4